MRRIHTVYTVICVTLVAFALQGCQQKRNPGPDDGYVQKPYSLFIVDEQGLVWGTNDGEKFKRWSGSQGAGFVESVYSSGHRLIFRAPAGADLHVSEPDTSAGVHLNTNPSYRNLNIAAFGPAIAIQLEDFNDTPKAGPRDRFYVASGSGKPVAYSEYNADPDSVWWHEDGQSGLTVSTITSFAQLANGLVIAYDDATRKIFTRDNIKNGWTGKNSNGLPAAGQGQTYVINKGNDVLVVIVNGDATTNGIYESKNFGDDFSKLPEIDGGIYDITGATGAFGKVLIASTKTNGIWRLGGQGEWERTFGLDEGTEVHGVLSKYNKFKSEEVREYIYAATSTGLYRSDDLGQNWVKLNLELYQSGVVPNIIAIH